MGVQNSPISNTLEIRLKNLNDYFTYSLYENICRSLFEKHKLLFSFLLTVRMEFFKDSLNPEEFRYFLTGPVGDITIKNNPVQWIDANSWPDIYKQIMGADSLFPGLEEFFINNLEQFKPFYDATDPQLCALPGEWDTKLNSFQKMIVLKALRSDKIVPAVQNFITDKIGKQFIMNPSFDLSKCFKDSTVMTPLIFVLSPGSDPVADYLKFWDEMGMSQKYDQKIISLGQGQGKNAEDQVRAATQKGGWVLLQNCHLSIKWLTELEKIVEDFNENINKDFRLWLTSNPEPKFPISILQNGIKMTLEPPQGLRNNLLRTYANLDDKVLEDCAKPDEFKKLLFGFCLFHAIIQDRRKFGPIGWNIAYDFTNEDLLCCRRQLQALLNDYDEIPYKVINFLGSRVNYGGRVTQAKDIILIVTILKNYICEEVLTDTYKFSESGTYYSIPAGGQQDYLNYIENLPLNPSPEAFGLHDNAQITNSQSNTRDLLSTMLSISSKSSGATGKTREEQIEEIATYVQSKTPELFNEEDVEKRYPTDYNQSLNTILLQEVIKYNKVLKVMIESLKLVKLALIGRIGMSDELNGLANSLFENRVPEMWSDVSYLSLKPLASWTNDLNQRCEFFAKWAADGTPNVFWFSGFFFPQAFITGVMQNYARQYVIAIDRLDFDYEIKDDVSPADIKEAPKDGCLIYGLFLEGCRWDYEAHQLTDSRNKELFSDLPMIYLKPQKDRPEVTNDTANLYLCPLYKVQSRAGTLLTTGHSTNFVRDLELKTDREQKVWIKAGVAAFLSLRY